MARFRSEAVHLGGGHATIQRETTRYKPIMVVLTPQYFAYAVMEKFRLMAESRVRVTRGLEL
jgi:hypothetical protein